MTSTVIDIIRHGLPEGGNRIRGNGVDDALSSIGWSQMRRSAAAIDGWDRVITSPLRRCRAFAEWLADQRGLPLSVEPELREVGFGAWEGIARETLMTERRDEYDAFYQDPVHNRPAGAEPLADFGRRITTAFDATADAYRGEHLLIVGHAGVIRATLGHVLQAPAACWYRTDVSYAAITRFTRDQRATRVVLHNWRPDPSD
jgi:alpha-ribazole phosphatase/probable phosphoglycerate mutase